MQKWHLIQNKPSLQQIYKELPIISFKRGNPLKDMLERAKLWRENTQTWFICPLWIRNCAGLSLFAISYSDQNERGLWGRECNVRLDKLGMWNRHAQF